MRMRNLALAMGLLLGGACAAQDQAHLPPPMSIEALRSVAALPAVLHPKVAVDGGDAYDGLLLGYEHAGLRLHALLALPKGTPPASGWPIVVAVHGFHPNPPRYGFTASGRDWRPGDYYRAVPAAFASMGYAVLMPDLRGHNSSEGYAFTRLPQAVAYYSEDVVALLAGVPSLAGTLPVDVRQLFMWGHSMGADVAVRAAPASPLVKALSLWSTVDVLGNAAAANVLDDLSVPVQLQHANDDATTPVHNSTRLAQAMRMRGKAVTVREVPGNAHLFQDRELALAVAEDARFFRRAVLPERP
jgi:uncharacterized protein